MNRLTGPLRIAKRSVFWSFRQLRRIPGGLIAIARRALSGAPHPPSLIAASLGPDDEALAARLLKHQPMVHDPAILEAFQREFAAWNGSRHSFAFMGGRMALGACIHALGLYPGGEVILPAYTCIVVPTAFLRAGLKIVHADIELDTYGLDIADVRKKVTKRTKAILLHHLYGLVCRDYDAIIDFARENGIFTIEDCAHATGARHGAVRVGNRADCGFYSFEQSKVMTTIQGGMAVTNDGRIGERLKAYHDDSPVCDPQDAAAWLRMVGLNFARFNHPYREIAGPLAELTFGYGERATVTSDERLGRLPTRPRDLMHSALAEIGSNQLAKIDKVNARRRIGAQFWDSWCEAIGYRRPVVIPGSEPVFLRYPVLAPPGLKKNPLQIENWLGMDVGVWFKGKHHPVDVAIADCPNAELALRNCINFPCYLSDRQIEYYKKRL